MSTNHHGQLDHSIEVDNRDIVLSLSCSNNNNRLRIDPINDDSEMDNPRALVQ